ncbi:MAG TPA: Rieske 2Fe-2S domain-containing protein [Gaiellaceae bacterium]|jgi:Rieske Fe-S protein
MQEEHGPAPTLWPLGFAVGIAVALVGLIIDPTVVAPIGAAIAIVFGFLWARDATSEMRRHVPVVHAEVREATPEEIPAEPATAAAVPASTERFARSRFLEGATLGLGGVIGGVLTIPVAGFALLPSFLDQKGHKVDMGPVSAFPIGKWFISTFIVNPAEGEVSRRTAFVRNNGPVANNVPSFTIISNRCAHLGCPVQANGPTGAILGEKNVMEHTQNGPVLLRPVVPAGFGCPCHGGQYDTEGNRTAGPPVRALDRYSFEIDNGRLVLLSTFSVSHVVGTGAQAKIYKYKEAGPGQHVDGPEQWFYPLQPPHH